MNRLTLRQAQGEADFHPGVRLFSALIPSLSKDEGASPISRNFALLGRYLLTIRPRTSGARDFTACFTPVEIAG